MKSYRVSCFKAWRLAFALTPFLCAVWFGTATVYQQTKKPISKEGLVRAIQLNGLSTSELIQQIQLRGVMFQVTPAIESELRGVGARPEVIAAARSNYRPPTPVQPIGRSTGRTRRDAPPPPPVNVRRGPDYDELTDQATNAINMKDGGGAARLLQQAIALDAAQPRAYQLLGFTQLYLQNDIATAERNMRTAIERGGSAAFRVYHDHANGSFMQTCQGSLFVTKSNVTFKADNGADTFEADDPDIAEMKTNRLVGSNYGAFHIKVQGGKNYNFAPLTRQKEEAKLIIAMFESYQRNK